MASGNLGSPAHRAAVRFLQGGLIAVVSLVLPVPLGALAAALPVLSPLVTLLRTLVPLCGFAAGGAVGGEALGFGTRGSVAFGLGGFAAGVVFHFAAPNLQGLTGFEDTWAVIGYGVLSSIAAFGLAGAVGSLVIGHGRVASVTGGFVAGGAIGGVLGVLPFLLQRSVASWSPDLGSFLSIACLVGSIVVPLAAGGAVAARAWSEIPAEAESVSK